MATNASEPRSIELTDSEHNLDDSLGEAGSQSDPENPVDEQHKTVQEGPVGEQKSPEEEKEKPPQRPAQLKQTLDRTSFANKALKKPLLLNPAAAQKKLNFSTIQQPTAQNNQEPPPKPAGRYTFATGRGNYPNHIINCLKARENWTQVSEEVAIDSANLLWRQLNLNFQGYDQLDNRLESQPNKAFFLNHFENTRGICTKTGLIRSLQLYYAHLEVARNAGYTVFDSTPTTFVISRVSEEDEINLLMHRFKEIARGGSNKERVPFKHCEQNMWLVKPASLNQGRGIEIFRNLRDINEFIFHKNPQTKYWVVQKYVERPFLFNGRKFDIRIWAIVTDDFRVFVYKQGYLRTSSSEYDLKDRNNYVHLTNQCLQVKGEGYAIHEEGNTLSFEDLQTYLDRHFGQYKLNVEELLMPRIKDIIIDTFLCVRRKMNANHRQNVFELFGFDFLLDEDFRVWLIEVNYNPYLGTPNEYMRGLVPRMVDDMLKIVLDPVLPPRTVPDPDRENEFELIFRDQSEKHGPAVNKRRPFSLDLIYPVPELIPFIGKKKMMDQKGPVIPVRHLQPSKRNETLLQHQKTLTGDGSLSQTITDGNMISPRREMVSSESGTSSATASGRSKSVGPGKLVFSMRRKTRGSSSNYGGQDRQQQSVSAIGKRSKFRKGPKRKRAEAGIIEQVEEENRLSGDSDSGDDEARTRNIIRQKKNLLCKNLLDQTKELCYQHSPVYKDFDVIFARIMTRLQDWELFEDEEIMLACHSLKVISNSGQIVNLVQEKNMKRVIQIYASPDQMVKTRVEISEMFLIIAKNIGLRKIFLNTKLHEMLVKYSLAFLNQAMTPSIKGQMILLFQNAIKLLCLVCTARKNQFYIPGETNLSERLRKRAFDSGTFTLLTYLFGKLKTVERQPFKEMREHIKETVLNYANMTDLSYHVRLIRYMIKNPQACASNLRLNQSSALDERKEADITDVSSQHEHATTKLLQPTSDSEGGLNTPVPDRHLPKISDRSSQQSPHVSNSKGRMKKANSQLSYATQHVAGGGSMNAGGAPLKDKTLYEVDTEKLLLSNDKVNKADLWKMSPQPTFPSFFLELLDLNQILANASEKMNTLKKKIDKRKFDERKKEEAIKQQQVKQMEIAAEARRMRVEQQERRKAEQKRIADELRRRADIQTALKLQQQQHQIQGMGGPLVPHINAVQAPPQPQQFGRKLMTPNNSAKPESTTVVSSGQSATNVLKQIVRISDPTLPPPTNQKEILKNLKHAYGNDLPPINVTPGSQHGKKTGSSQLSQLAHGRFQHEDNISIGQYQSEQLQDQIQLRPSDPQLYAAVANRMQLSDAPAPQHLFSPEAKLLATSESQRNVLYFSNTSKKSIVSNGTQGTSAAERKKSLSSNKAGQTLRAAAAQQVASPYLQHESAALLKQTLLAKKNSTYRGEKMSSPSSKSKSPGRIYKRSNKSKVTQSINDAAAAGHLLTRQNSYDKMDAMIQQVAPILPPTHDFDYGEEEPTPN